ncbi:PepSY-associated TM helix domain-containing protein [Microbacterium marinilacus]|uniref:PepSY-associated TM helix domain-containing protein n=1 Tax=Microbacterium marinilacus TaxID=415209 RepID=A0ABP7BQZ8_9MICO|nr:PepSY-associated TM helix domain-containing protein [Microbacterium marinilacus]MBY0689219.1 PepSY domain-containing protein [Microbacterium marinilacus]
MTTTLTQPAESTHPPRPARRGGWFGPLLLRLHFYAGILVGPFILIAATSGALYALTPTIEQIVYQDELHAPATGTRLTLAEQIGAAQAHLGDADATLSAVRPAPEPGDTTRIMYAQDGLGESESRAVFVDPGTGEIRGDLTVYGTSGALPLRTWIDQLHRSLHLGDVGRLYSELAASWLGIVALAGLGLWIVRIRKTRAKKDMIRPNRTHKGYRGLFTWHTSVGIWVLLGALFLSATGITWSQYAGGNVSNLRAALDWGTPAVNTSLTGEEAAADEHAGHGGHAGHGAASAEATGDANPATFDAVLAIAQRTNVNTGLVEIKPPAEPGAAWVVQEIQRSYPTEVDAVAIDGTTMQVVDRADFAEFTLAAKLTRWGIDIHMGSMFGLANQIALFVLAAGIATMVVLGYLMWWKRRPTREPRTPFGRPPARGALRGAPWWGVGAVVAAGIAIGWWLPLVGWTLVAFMAIDLVVGAVRARRSRAS